MSLLSHLAVLHPSWLVFALLVPILAYWLWRRLKIGKKTFIGLLIASVLAIPFGFGLVEIPHLEDLPLQKYVSELGDKVGDWAYALVGLLAFLETGAFVGLVAPGETFVILGGVLAGEGTLNIVTLVAVVWACAFAGDMCSYWLGRKLGRDFVVKHGPKLKITEARLDQVETFFNKHGGKAVIIGRFLGLVRALAPFVLGSSKVPLKRFAPYSIVGTGLWAGLFTTLGYIFWHSLDQLLKWVKQGALVFGLTVSVIVAAIFFAHWLAEPENKAKVAAAWKRFAETALGRRVVSIWKRIEGPVRFTWNRITPGNLGLELTTMTAIMGAGFFGFFAVEEMVNGKALPKVDEQVLTWIDKVRFGALDEVASNLVHLGDRSVVLVAAGLAVLLLLFKRQWIWAVVLILSVAASITTVQMVNDHYVDGHLQNSLRWQFPSVMAAHTVVWVAIGLALAQVVKRFHNRLGLTTIGLLVALAACGAGLQQRLFYPSDVAAGAALAAAIMALITSFGIVISHYRQNV